ncbi:amino acid adenylation domain-containing protein [Pseudomonas sp. B2M1-30]|uniref:non-ribosomal peptide synthetase n=1 Tax=Pseudomonas TaxID=286 RepID=UPI0021CAD853|nr:MULTISPECIES: non-ribosomal peptide synthetase [Pseudomonas]MCU0121632.1 amino acid adenylation domain-containing protein [Pseudomonas sp. B2M1-30]MCU7263740.1 amino acid adenylation domain-containing protein [Pseudomonas koreensis]
MRAANQMTLLARFAEQVQRNPQAPAVIDQSLTLTYAELASASERIARGLQARGIRPGQSLALCMPRGWQWLAVILGALKIGAVVVPLDRASPSKRRELMLADAACVGLITLNEEPTLSSCWQASIDALLDQPDYPPQPLAEDFAEVMFLFYTSGTTGTPKAVEVGERGLLRLAHTDAYIEIRPTDRFACLSNPAFDACSFELWAPLLNGGCCVMIADEDVLDARRLAAVLEQTRVDNLFMTVSLFNTLIADWPACFSSLRQVLIGGEQISAAAVRAWYRANPQSRCRIFNVYGPTECTTFALCWPIGRDFAGDFAPIGRALPDTGVWVLDERQRPVAAGEVGELYLSGSGVARGYRNRPEETARQFLRLPALDGGAQVHYRTGDLVRRNADGLIEYLGRVDRQVKIRGFRIEPGEVEQRMLEHRGVAQVFVCARRQAAEDHQLLAFIVPRFELDFHEFEAHLRTHLAPYMRPHQLFLLARLPLTANGKIDRDSLLAQTLKPWHPVADAVDEGQTSPALSWLLAEVRSLLGQPALSAQDDWLGSGGDSLKAMRLRSAIRRQWQREISIGMLLDQSFATLAEHLSDELTCHTVYPPAPAISNARRLPATAEQRRLWLLQQRTPTSTAYNVPLILHLAAGADVSALAEAVGRLVARHPGLRTAFVAGAEGLDQVIADQGPTCRTFAPGHFTEDNWQAFAALVFDTPFDLTTPALFQAWLLPFVDGSCRLLLNLHHIVVDGWSVNLLFDDLTQLYTDAVQNRETPDPSPRLTALEFGQWQRQWSVDAHYRDQRRALAELHRRQEEPSSALTPMRAISPDARLLREPLGVVRSAALERFCTQQRLTRFEVLFSVFAWSLYALTGVERPRIASPVSNRPLAEFEASVGMFANTVLIPAAVEHALTLGEQLRRQTSCVREVLALQDVALADLVEDLRLSSSNALFDFMFVLENTDYAALADSSLHATLEFSERLHAKCPLTLLMVGAGSQLECWWEYQCSYFDAEQMRAVNALFRRGLDLLLETPAATLDDLLGPYRLGLPVASEGLGGEVPFNTLADWFEHQVLCTPHATALVQGSRRLTYTELNTLADSLAATVIERHPLPVGNDAPLHVVLFLDTSVEHIVALLALAKLNLTAVPLDPAYPLAIQRQVLEQAQPHCLLFSRSTEAALEDLDSGRFDLHRVDLQAEARPFERPRHAGERPLYTLFTSGSTGTPKGVQVSERTLCNLLQWQRTEGQLPAKSVTLQFSMLSFDVSFQEIFSTLCGGGSYHLITPCWRQNAEALLAYMVEARIERLFLPCVALQHLAQTAVARGVYPSALREVVTAGEQLLCTDALRQWFSAMPQASLFNHYGPTETHVVSALRLPPVARDWPLRAPIGHAVGNARLLLVDEHDRPVPIGSRGYLLVAGPMVARCYLADPALNAARFVELPQADGDSRLFYRTGDLAWADAQGCLHYLGRDDQQIKLSGHRLELGQIEAALMQVPQVVNAVVAVQAEPQRLIAWLQLDGEPATSRQLDRQVTRQLPAHVRIDEYRRIDLWPRTPSGKVDRKALPGLGEALERRSPPQPVVALSALERQLSELFSAVIGRDIEPEQTFFEAGATSLGLMRLHARYNQELPNPVAMADLFEHVTIRRLAAHLSAVPGTAVERVRQADAGHQPMAIIGMSVNVAGAQNLGEFWAMVQGNALGIERFVASEGLVGARSQLAGMLDFDPEYFGISRQEARLMDPQQRHLLMGCVQALQHAAIVPATDGPRIGLIASCGETTYFQQMLRDTAAGDLPDGFQMALHHDKDFLATKAAYHLNLNGPALSVQAACGSSLIAVHMASAMLRQGDSDVMLAAGVLIDPTLSDGYRHRSQHIFSADGLCRPFSDDASGTIGASGYGVVVLKPLAQARADGDRIYALLEGSALNNDGRAKMSYTAPSVAGQSAVISDALSRAGLTGADIGYVEAHGTGTLLGDPIEVAALTKAFGDAPADSCALASVKSQIGHLGAAAGVVGLIRASLAVFHGVLPPNLGFGRINPQIDLEHSPFYIPTTSRPWPQGRRRLAGVSSFGIGGTNAHVIVGAAPKTPDTAEDTLPLLMISAHSRAELLRDIAAIKAHLQRFPELHGALLRHLQSGRRQLRWRFAMVCRPGDDIPLQPTSIREVAVSGVKLIARDHSPLVLLEAWYEGVNLDWPQRSAPPPWDLPPSSFDLQTCRFQPAATAAVVEEPSPGIERQPLADWFHQRQWMRVRRLSAMAKGARREGLILCSHDAPNATLLESLGTVYRRVIQVRAGNGFKRLGTDRFELDPLDADALARLLDEVAGPALVEMDWLHALPLAVSGAVNEQSLDLAQWACLDTVSALMQAWGQTSRTIRLRLWLMSWQACPVEGEVRRPELAALAGICEVVPQEYPLRCHWLDWSSPSIGAQAGELAAVLSDPASLPRRLAVRDGYLWQPRLIAHSSPSASVASSLLPEDGTFLVLGGSGGIGRTLCEHLLQAPARRVVLLSRQAELPLSLAPYASRIDCIQADIADLPQWPQVLDQLARRHGRLAGVIHAAGVGAGSLIRHRDAGQMAQAMAAKTRGMLAVETLIEQLSPGFVLYCSSMSALFGGAGHLDYAAASGVLDGFAHYRPNAASACVRLGINWDIWRDIGMATTNNGGDAAHQEHLTVGLSAEEGCRVFDLAMATQLPQLLISTTGIDTARRFYPVRHGAGSAPVEAPKGTDLPARLRECLCKWLGVGELDDDDSLYDLGADSLTLLDLIDELQAATGEVFQLSQFSHKVSLNEVLALVQACTVEVPIAAPQDWSDAVRIDQWHAGAGQEWLYLIHPVGGDVQAYRELVSALHPDLGVCVIADPALRLPALPNISVVERAQWYLHAIQAHLPADSAWRLAGWSFGAWVAQALCQQAQTTGFRQPLLYLIDPPAPDAGAELAGIDEQTIEQVFQREFAQRWPDGEGQAMSDERLAYLQRLTVCCRNNMSSMADFQPPALAATAARMFIAGHANPYGLGNAWNMDDLQHSWRALLPRLLSWQRLDTDHYGIVAGRWARMIAEVIGAREAST